MKSKLILKIINSLENFFLKRDKNSEKQEDVYLSGFVLFLGLFLILVGIGIAVALFFYFNIVMIIASAFFVLLGVVAVMCWKNQRITVISDEKFEYTTFLGNTYEYRFKDITGVWFNNDSTTIFINEKKVHIEDSAVVSDRFIELLNSAIKTNNL